MTLGQDLDKTERERYQDIEHSINVGYPYSVFEFLVQVPNNGSKTARGHVQKVVETLPGLLIALGLWRELELHQGHATSEGWKVEARKAEAMFWGVR